MTVIMCEGNSIQVSSKSCNGEVLYELMPSIYGRRKSKHDNVIGDIRQYYVADEAEARRGLLNLSCSYQLGKIVNYEEMEKIWVHCFNSVSRINPQESNLLIAVSPCQPQEERDKIIQMMFDYFDFPKLFLKSSAELSLINSKLTSGVVFDCGDGITTVVPVIDGKQDKDGIQAQNFAGHDITQYLACFLNESGFDLCTIAEMEIVNDIKEQKCYVCEDYEKEMQLMRKGTGGTNYELPDGQVIHVGFPLFKAPEMLFNPKIVGKKNRSVQNMIQNSVSLFQERAQSSPKLVLTGGTTMLRGFDVRLPKELKLLNCDVEITNTISNSERRISSFMGGMIYSQVLDNSNGWVTKEQWEEYGATVSRFM